MFSVPAKKKTPFASIIFRNQATGRLFAVASQVYFHRHEKLKHRRSSTTITAVQQIRRRFHAMPPKASNTKPTEPPPRHTSQQQLANPHHPVEDSGASRVAPRKLSSLFKKSSKKQQPAPLPTEPGPQTTQSPLQLPQRAAQQGKPTPPVSEPTGSTPQQQPVKPGGVGAGSGDSPATRRVLSCLLDDDCPRCSTTLVLKENPNPTRGDFPPCSGFDDYTCAWPGLLVKFPKLRAVCLRTLDLQRAA